MLYKATLGILGPPKTVCISKESISMITILFKELGRNYDQFSSVFIVEKPTKNTQHNTIIMYK